MNIKSDAAVSLDALHRRIEELRTENAWDVLGALYSSESEKVEIVQGPGGAIENQPLFGIGSCTKAMSAALMIKNIELGILSWESTIGDVASVIKERGEPELKVSDSLKKVRIESLLTHTGGVPDYFAYEEQNFEKSIEYYLETNTGENVATFGYSSLGYSIIAYLSSRLAGKRYDILLRENLFDPLEIKSCLVQTGVFPNPPAIDAENAKRIIGPGLTEATEPFNAAGGAAVFCSLTDWEKFARYLVNGYHGEAKPSKLLLENKASYEQIFQEKEPHNYTYGAWSEVDGTYSHNGSNGTYYAFAEIDVESREVTLVATNSLPWEFGPLYYVAAELRKFFHPNVP